MRVTLLKSEKNILKSVYVFFAVLALCVSQSIYAQTSCNGLAGSVNSQVNVSCFGGSNGSVTLSASGGTLGNGGYAFGDAAAASTVYIRFKEGDNAPSPWNSITGVSSSDLLDAAGNNSGMGLELEGTPFNVYHSGPQTGDNSGIYPDAVLKDYFYFGIYGAPETVTSKVTGLDITKKYSLTFYAGSVFSGPGVIDNGTTQYTIGTTTVSLYVQGNTQNSVSINDITPDNDGTITFTMAKSGADGTPVGYLNALVVRALTSTGLVAGGHSYTVTDAVGCSANIDATIEEPAQITASAGITDAITCNGGTGTVTITAGGGTAPLSYTLNGVTNETGIFTVSAGEDLPYSVTDANACAAATGTITVSQPDPVPVPTLLADGSVNFCSGGSVTLTSSTAPGYQWYNHGIVMPGVVSNSYFVTVSGNYQVVAIDNDGCSSELSDSITVYAHRIPDPLVVSPGSAAICEGKSVVLTSTQSLFAYQWYKDGDLIPGETAKTYTASSAGSYTVVNISKFNCVSAQSTGVQVTVNPVPDKPVIDVGSSASFCEGGSVTLTSSPEAGYQWYRGNNPIRNRSTSQTYDANSKNDYSVQVINSFGCASVLSDPTHVKVLSLPPVPTISINSNTLCSGGKASLISSKATSYQWNASGVPVDGETSKKFITRAEGSYTVTVKGENQCSSTSDPVVLSCVEALAMKNQSGADAGLTVKVLPNPSVTDFTIQLKTSDQKTPVEIKVVDVYGKSIYQLRGPASQSYKFGQSFLPGIYMVQVAQGKNVQIVKVVKSK